MPKEDKSIEAVEVFYSYAHEDEEFRKQLEIRLKGLQRRNLIKTWDDRKIIPGEQWKNKIDDALERAQLVLLLISDDFIASEYCYSIEMARAIERHNAGEVRVIPIILRPCDWQELEFGKFQALPDQGRPVTKYKLRDDAYLNITRGIERAIKGEMEAETNHKETDKARPPIPPLLPYLCDRSPQEETLEETLAPLVDETLSRPFLCLIYGSEYECHDKFRERLQERSLKKIINPESSSYAIVDFMLRWPSGFTSREACFELIQRNLAHKFLGRGRATKAEIVEAISLYKAPVMINSLVSTENWEPHGPALVKAFIDYWNDSWELPYGPHLFICLHIEYSKNRAEFVEREARVQEFINSLRASDYDKLHLILLPELDSVPEIEVKYWIKDEENFTGFCPVHKIKFCNVQDVLELIDKLYEDRQLTNEAGGISMQPLARKLKDMLEENRCQKD
jgi:TIR domain.